MSYEVNITDPYLARDSLIRGTKTTPRRITRHPIPGEVWCSCAVGRLGPDRRACRTRWRLAACRDRQI